MNIIYVLFPIALFLSAAFVFAFVRATASGQYDDLDTPAAKILLDDVQERKSGQ